VSAAFTGLTVLGQPPYPGHAEDWDRLPDRFGFDPAREAEWRDLKDRVIFS
jgi:hypothetical protein